MTKKQTGNRYLAIHILILILILLAIANAIDPHLFWKHFVRVDYPLHSAMEATGALAAIIMGLMSIRYLIGVKESRYEIISLSLLAMGSWDLFHAVLHEGGGFVLTHNISLLLGGFFYFLVIFKWSDKLIKKKNFLKILSIILFVLLGILLIFNREKLPSMISESGNAGHFHKGAHFTPLANLMNVLAGVFFLIGSVKVYVDYRKYRKLGLLLLVLLGVQSASAGFLFPYSHAWADSWWFWHILRFLAFTGILTYMISQFSIILAERTKTLKDIQESENKFSRLFDSEPDALFIADAETGIITQVNEAAQKLMKMSAEELIGISQMELHPPEKREEIAELFKEIALKGTRTPQQIVVQNSQGEIIPVEVVGNVIKIGEKNIAIGIFRDISDRIALESEREKLNKKFRKFIEQVPLPLCIINQDSGDFSFFNDSFLKLFGYYSDDLKNIEDWWVRAYPDEEYRRWVQQNWQKATEKAEAAKTEIESDVYNVSCKDGVLKNVIISGVIIDNELLATFIDITDIKQAEQAIIAEKTIFESTVDSLPGVFYQINAEGYYERWNHRFKEVTGYNDEELSKIHALDFFSEDDKKKVAKAIEKVFTKGEAEVEADLVIKSGEKIPYMYNGKMFMINEKPYLIGMGMDITRLKRIEKNLRKSNKELEAFNRIAVGREKRMIELKEKINLLSKELGKEAPYDLTFVQNIEEDEEE